MHGQTRLAIHSVGAPPEQHADRVVAEMLHVLVRGRLEREKHIKATLNLPDGNPRAQAKLAKKLEERGWPFILSLRETGKRGRYELNFVTWTAGAPAGTSSPTRRTFLRSRTSSER